LLAIRTYQPDRVGADLLVYAYDVGYLALHLPRCYRFVTYLKNAKSGVFPPLPECSNATPREGTLSMV
jgi:hypothetical protein